MISSATYPEKTFIKLDIDNRNVYIYRQGEKGPIVFWPYKFWENESPAKDAWMQTIDSCYNKQYSLAKQDKNIKKVLYQKNKGGHFANTDLRVINGIKWLLENRCS